MSVSLGIYDFFAYIIPGLLYLFTLNEFLRVIGWRFADVGTWLQAGQAPSLFLAIPLLLAAYLMGHILDPLAYNFYCEFIYSLRHKRKVYDKQLQYLKEIYPGLEIRFQPKDWNALFALIRQRNPETAQYIDKFQADSIMLRNIALGALLLFFVYLVVFFSTGSWSYFLAALVSLLLSLLAIGKSNKFRAWFYKSIYESAIEYGTSLQDVVSHPSIPEPASQSPRTGKQAKAKRRSST